MTYLPLATLTSLLYLLFLFFDSAFGQEKTIKHSGDMFRLRVAYTALAGNMAPLWIAGERNYFAEYGLAVEQIYTRTITGIQAMLAGDLQVIYAACAQVMTARRAGANLVLIASTSHYNPYVLASRSEIKDARQLLGKRVAVNQLKDATYVSARFALKQLGLNPDGVVYVPIGSTPERLVALQKGAVDAAIYGGPQEVLRELGMNVLIDLLEQKIPYCGGGIAVSDTFLKRNPQIIEAFIRGLLKGNAYYFEGSPDSVKTILAKFIRLNIDDKRVNQIYTHFKHNAKNPVVTGEGVAATLDILGHADQSWHNMKAEHFYDNTVMNRLMAEGFLQGVYKQLP